MTPDTFRHLALELPEVMEWVHLGKPDFRVGGRIFATLGDPDRGWGMVALRPHEQDRLIASAPTAYRSASGSWGLRGYTQVNLTQVDEATLRPLLLTAWRWKAGSRLVKRHASLVEPEGLEAPIAVAV
ncbi:MmcQ/YjbR family DNA-binding protein [Muricoccus pecuniae]|uniref:MmcQ/YjbR family DNA-binding protein n=1 Tax=Muricoccus pecuniae TaxID=693023 RepID=UPI001C8668F6